MVEVLEKTTYSKFDLPSPFPLFVDICNDYVTSATRLGGNIRSESGNYVSGIYGRSGAARRVHV